MLLEYILFVLPYSLDKLFQIYNLFKDVYIHGLVLWKCLKLRQIKGGRLCGAGLFTPSTVSKLLSQALAWNTEFIYRKCAAGAHGVGLLTPFLFFYFDPDAKYKTVPSIINGQIAVIISATIYLSHYIDIYFLLFVLWQHFILGIGYISGRLRGDDFLFTASTCLAVFCRKFSLGLY